MRYLSVCSGIEAASVAWEPLGWECAGVAEIDAFPSQVLAHRFGAGKPKYMPDPDAPGLSAKDRKARVAAIKAINRKNMVWGDRIPNFGDFTQIKGDDVGSVDILVGGTPCQSFSIAGKRLGLDDPRGNLTLEFLALARRIRAKWILWENVPGVLSHDKGKTFGTFLGLLGECGYDRAGWRVLDAQHVRVGRFPRAVPQRRRRVFLVGYSGTAGIHPRAVLFDRESLRGDPAPCREAGQRPAPTLAARTQGGGGLGTDFEIDGGLISAVFNRQSSGEYGEDSVGSTCQARDYKDATDLVAHALRGEGFDASEDGTGRGAPIVPVRPHFQDSEYGCAEYDTAAIRAGRIPEHSMILEHVPVAPKGEVAGALCKDTFSGGAGGRPEAAAVGHFQPIAFTAKDHGGDAVEGISPTLRAGGHSSSHANAGVMPAIATEWAVRRLTPTECARLQGFPDDWAKIPWRGKPAEQCPDGPQYKAYGNSMAVNVMSWLGERIAAVEAIATGQLPD